MIENVDHFAIETLLAEFANSFDTKEWAELGNCLSDQLYTDYSDFRHTEPETLSREKFIELRQSTLQNLMTHHVNGNFEVTVNGDLAEARVSTVIYRKSSDGKSLTTHCLYSFKVEKDHARWTIYSIVQKLLWNEGDTSIHTGVIKD